MNQKKTKFFQKILEIGNLFESKDSFAQCFSSDFKISTGIVRSFKRKFQINYSENTKSPLFAEKIDDCFICHLVTKKRFSRKPTYDGSRQPLEAMKYHSNKHKVT